MYLVTGANGQLGTLVIKELLKTIPASEIVAAVRRPESSAELKSLGVQIRQADYQKKSDWDSALQGVNRVLLISSSDFNNRSQQHKNVIDAIKASPTVTFVAYTSILKGPRSHLTLAADHIETEKWIESSGRAHSILRNSWYLENYAGSILSSLEHGAIYGSAKHGKISAATREDYAKGAAKVLLLGEKAKSHYEFAGDFSFTMAELASLVSKRAKKEIKYIDVPEAEYKELLIKVGLPAPVASILADADAQISRGDLYEDSRALSQLTGERTKSLADYLNEIIKA